MTDRFVTHATFTLEREYAASPERVFAAWADPESKSRWFAGAGAEHELDFRVGGRELNRGSHDGGPVLTFESWYRDIVPGERIVYSSTMSTGNGPVTISVTTVEFEAVGGGTRQVLTEYGAFLDGHEDPAWRERGTGGWLEALGTELRRTTTKP